MQEDWYWTYLSQAEIADSLGEMGTPVSQPTAGRLLKDHGFAKRQIEKTIAGGNVPERNQQFEIIEALKNRYFDEKNPVFSIDTKKKELLGTFYRKGRV
jgi:arginine repressor